MFFFRIIVIIVFAYYLFKIIARYLLPVVLKSLINQLNKNLQHQQDQNFSDNQTTDSKSDLNYKTKNKKTSDWDKGEYIDFEEIKN